MGGDDKQLFNRIIEEICIDLRKTVLLKLDAPEKMDGRELAKHTQEVARGVVLDWIKEKNAPRPYQEGEARRLTPMFHLELTRYGGHLIFWEKGVHYAQDASPLSCSVSATDRRVGQSRWQPG